MSQIIFENLDISVQDKINNAGITLPISASDVTPLPSRTFVTSNQSAAIDAHTNEIASQTARIASVEQNIATISTSDELVKMNTNGVAGYLAELIDGLTITNVNGKLQVQNLNNLLSTITELNTLQGIQSNVQQQLNNLSGVSSFRGVFADLMALQAASNPQDGQYAIVSTNGSSEYYFYYSGAWEYSHSATGSSDIDINTGTIGVLAKNRYVLQNATETTFSNNTTTLQATNTQDAIVEVFRFADSLLKGLTQTVGSPLLSTDSIDVSLQKFEFWWAGLANAITNKGVSTSTSNNGNEMIQKIGAIPNVSVNSGLKRVSKLNVTAPYNLDIVLNEPLKLEDICATLFEYVPGATGVVKYDVKFNNSDKADFEPNDFIEFDGVAKLQTRFDLPVEEIASWSGGGSMQKIIFDRNDFDSIGEFKFQA